MIKNSLQFYAVPVIWQYLKMKGLFKKLKNASIIFGTPSLSSLSIHQRGGQVYYLN